MLHIFLPLPYEEIKEDGNLSNEAIPFPSPPSGGDYGEGLGLGRGCVFFYIIANNSSMC